MRPLGAIAVAVVVGVAASALGGCLSGTVPKDSQTRDPRGHVVPPSGDPIVHGAHVASSGSHAIHHVAARTHCGGPIFATDEDRAGVVDRGVQALAAAGATTSL